MTKRKTTSATDSPPPNYEKALFRLVSGLPMRNREKLRAEIELLHSLTGGTQDLFVDRRKLTWSKDGVARKTLAEKPKKLDVRIVWRGGDTSIYASMEEAAKIANKTKTTLMALLNRHGGTWSFIDEDDDIVTIFKLSEPLRVAP